MRNCNRLRVAAFLFVELALTVTAFAAEPLVVDVWPGKAAGDAGIKGEENSRTYESAARLGKTR